jgi:hypothetical protein
MEDFETLVAEYIDEHGIDEVIVTFMNIDDVVSNSGTVLPEIGQDELFEYVTGEMTQELSDWVNDNGTFEVTF